MDIFADIDKALKSDTGRQVFSVAHPIGKGILSAFGAGALAQPVEQLEQQQGYLATAPNLVVTAPDYVVAISATTGKAAEIPGMAQVAVTGGKRFAGNGYQSGETPGKHFSFGVDAPSRVDFVAKTGEKTSLTDVKQVLFLGGTEQTTRVAGGEATMSDIDDLEGLGNVICGELAKDPGPAPYVIEDRAEDLVDNLHSPVEIPMPDDDGSMYLVGTDVLTEDVNDGGEMSILGAIVGAFGKKGVSRPLIVRNALASHKKTFAKFRSIPKPKPAPRSIAVHGLDDKQALVIGVTGVPAVTPMNAKLKKAIDKYNAKVSVAQKKAQAARVSYTKAASAIAALSRHIGKVASKHIAIKNGPQISMHGDLIGAPTDPDPTNPGYLIDGSPDPNYGGGVSDPSTNPNVSQVAAMVQSTPVDLKQAVSKMPSDAIVYDGTAKGWPAMQFGSYSFFYGPKGSDNLGAWGFVFGAIPGTGAGDRWTLRNGGNRFGQANWANYGADGGDASAIAGPSMAGLGKEGGGGGWGITEGSWAGQYSGPVYGPLIGAPGGDFDKLRWAVQDKKWFFYPSEAPQWIMQPILDEQALAKQAADAAAAATQQAAADARAQAQADADAAAAKQQADQAAADAAAQVQQTQSDADTATAQAKLDIQTAQTQADLDAAQAAYMQAHPEQFFAPQSDGGGGDGGGGGGGVDWGGGGDGGGGGGDGGDFTPEQLQEAEAYTAEAQAADAQFNDEDQG